MKKKSYLTVTDQFCGAGGSSQGVRNLSNRIGGGLEVALAMNHWKLAIETHNTNFPNTEHDCADISASDPRRYKSTDILITSPECTNHTIAKGIKRKYQQTNTLFGKLTVDPAAERSRATMWDVPRFAEIHNYNLIITENVVDARSWIMWDAWIHAMYSLGYQHKCVYLNSMHMHPTPQSRDRMYVVFWKKGNKAPDLDYRPTAYCKNCDCEVESIQSWRNPRRQYGKYKQQYDYRCPKCANVVDPYYYSAFNVIDWSIPGTRIGDRKKPLAKNTIARIEYGLEKYSNSDFVVYLDHSKAGHLVSDIDVPINTQTTAQVAGIVTTRYTSGIACRFKGPEEPIGTQPGDVSHAVLGIPTSPFIVQNNGTSFSHSIGKAIGAITAGGVNHGILSTESVNAFLSYYYGQSQATSMIDPSGTVTTKDRLAIVMKPTTKVAIEDCTYRMLKHHEIQKAMAFNDDYIICGNSGDKVKQLGNAVTPPAMEFLIDRGMQTFN